MAAHNDKWAVPTSDIPNVAWDKDPLFLAASDTTQHPGAPTSYAHPPAANPTDPEDVTSFHPAQAAWSPTNLPRILDRVYPTVSWMKCYGPGKHYLHSQDPPPLKDANGDVLLEQDGPRRPPRKRKYTPKPAPSTDPQIPQLVKKPRKTPRGRKAKPILDFEVLPRTICTLVENWRLEAWMRLDPRIQRKDILARMKDGPSKPKSNAMNMRLTRWRKREGNNFIAWRPGRDWDSLGPRDEMLAKLTDVQKQTNSTAGTVRPDIEWGLQCTRRNLVGKVRKQQLKAQGDMVSEEDMEDDEFDEIEEGEMDVDEHDNEDDEELSPSDAESERQFDDDFFSVFPNGGTQPKKQKTGHGNACEYPISDLKDRLKMYDAYDFTLPALSDPTAHPRHIACHPNTAFDDFSITSKLSPPLNPIEDDLNLLNLRPDKKHYYVLKDKSSKKRSSEPGDESGKKRTRKSRDESGNEPGSFIDEAAKLYSRPPSKQVSKQRGSSNAPLAQQPSQQPCRSYNLAEWERLTAESALLPPTRRGERRRAVRKRNELPNEIYPTRMVTRSSVKPVKSHKELYEDFVAGHGPEVDLPGRRLGENRYDYEQRMRCEPTPCYQLEEWYEYEDESDGEESLVMSETSSKEKLQ